MLYLIGSDENSGQLWPRWNGLALTARLVVCPPSLPAEVSLGEIGNPGGHVVAPTSTTCFRL